MESSQDESSIRTPQRNGYDNSARRLGRSAQDYIHHRDYKVKDVVDQSTRSYCISRNRHELKSTPLRSVPHDPGKNQSQLRRSHSSHSLPHESSHTVSQKYSTMTSRSHISTSTDVRDSSTRLKLAKNNSASPRTITSRFKTNQIPTLLDRYQVQYTSNRPSAIDHKVSNHHSLKQFSRLHFQHKHIEKPKSIQSEIRKSTGQSAHARPHPVPSVTKQSTLTKQESKPVAESNLKQTDVSVPIISHTESKLYPILVHPLSDSTHVKPSKLAKHDLRYEECTTVESSAVTSTLDTKSSTDEIVSEDANSSVMNHVWTRSSWTDVSTVMPILDEKQAANQLIQSVYDSIPPLPKGLSVDQACTDCLASLQDKSSWQRQFCALLQFQRLTRDYPQRVYTELMPTVIHSICSECCESYRSGLVKLGLFTLHITVLAYASKLHPWIDQILTCLFKKMGSSNPNFIKAAAASTLDQFPPEAYSEEYFKALMKTTMPHTIANEQCKKMMIRYLEKAYEKKEYMLGFCSQEPSKLDDVWQFLVCMSTGLKDRRSETKYHCRRLLQLAYTLYQREQTEATSETFLHTIEKLEESVLSKTGKIRKDVLSALKHVVSNVEY